MKQALIIVPLAITLTILITTWPMAITLAMLAIPLALATAVSL